MTRNLKGHGEPYYAVYFQKIPLMKFCMKENVTISLETNFIESSLKPKIIISVSMLLMLIALTFFYFSANKSR